MSDPASSPLNTNSPSPSPAPANPSTPAKPTSTTAKLSAQKATAGEPPKKKRLTTEEKAARDAEKRKRDEEREKKKREKDEAEKLKAQEKAAKADAEKLKAQQKAEEKAAKAAEKAEKEQEKRQRAEEREKKKREKEEEEAKKARSQMRLTSMFNRTATTPKKDAASKSDNALSTGVTAKNEAKETSLYDQMFKPFFIKENVKLARNFLQMDEETREAKTKILDEYLSGERQHPTTTFEPLEALQIPYKVRRGRVYPSVKKIMSEFEGLSTSTPTDQTTESQNAQMRHTLEVLKSVPVKSIKFREDVRPPYVGTISGLPPGVKSLQKLARKPISKILPLNYDYDSEAEWQEEEGEDVDDLDDDEEDAELDEDMEDFLDDSEDTGPARRVFSGGMEPESLGPCWENRKRSSAEPKLYKYRLEFVLGMSRDPDLILKRPINIIQNRSNTTTALTLSRPATGSRPSRRPAQLTSHLPPPHLHPHLPRLLPLPRVLPKTPVPTLWRRPPPRQMPSRPSTQEQRRRRALRSRSSHCRWTCSRN